MGTRRLSAAMIRHHKHCCITIHWLYRWQAYWKHHQCWCVQCDFILHVKGVTLQKIHHQLVEVYTAYVVSWNHVWIQCSAFGNGMTCWWPAVTWIPTHVHYRCKCVSCSHHKRPGLLCKASSFWMTPSNPTGRLVSQLRDYHPVAPRP